MTTKRFVLGLATASAFATIAGLAAWSHDGAAVAASIASALPAAAAETAACATDARGFRELLETVQKKSAALDEREAALAAREAALTAVRRAATLELERLDAVAQALGITAAPGGGAAIAKAYESMRPEEAAPILDRLDDATLRAILGRMRERQMGAVLAEMSHDRAVAVTKALAGTAAGRP
jgi:flagellar motility protein MotE (MotC chaperone)